MKSAVRLALLGMCLAALPAACGSSEGKKKLMREGGGGEGGEAIGGVPAVSGQGGSAGRGGNAGRGGSGGAPPMPQAGEGGVAEPIAGQSSGGEPTAECPAGTGECDGNPNTLCEQDLTNDLSNCGACAHVCQPTNGTPSCDGACHIACNANYGDCDGKPDSGCESDFKSDPNHCGACDVVCSTTNGTPSCDGSCHIACNADFDDCDGMIDTGCEASLKADVNNCGACKHACDATNGTPSCDGSCHIACNANYDDCDNSVDTGCETSLTTLANCGACKHACNGTNGTPSCDGSCHIACNKNFGNCDGNPDNGCELNLLNDDKNCGACGHDCTSYGATCSQGMCNGSPLQQGLAFGGDNGAGRTWAFDLTYGMFENGFNSYTLRRLPLDGSPALTIWTATKTSPTEGMVLVDDYVYWSERGTDTSHSFKSIVYKKLITDDASVLPTPAFVPEWSASFMQRQGNSLYWCSGGYQDEAGSAGYGGFIYGRALDAMDGGTKLVSVDQGNWSDFKGLGVTTDALYWVTDQNTGTQYELRTAPLAGTPITVVPAVFNNASLAVSNANANNGGDPVNLIPVGNYIYFNREAADPFDGIYRYKPGLTKPEQITIATGVYSMLVDTNDVYFIQSGAGGIWKAPINGGLGGASVQVSTTNAHKLIGLDDTYLYYAVLGCCQTTTYKVFK